MKADCNDDKTQSEEAEAKKEVKDNSAFITKEVREADYFFGFIPQADAEPFLKNEGDFLLRKSEHEKGIILAVSVKTNTVLHYCVNKDPSGNFYFEDHQEKSVAELIDWHFVSPGCLPSIFITTPKLGEKPHGNITKDSEVFTAEYGDKEVAAKILSSTAKREARLRFMKDARILRMMSHPNVIKILGMVVDDFPLMLVMENCPNGSLSKFLRNNKGNTTDSEKLRFSAEAADGLAHIHAQKCMHRDISAKNCLLSAKNEVKIAGFGISEKLTMVQDDQLEKLPPMKWLAPEIMQERIFSLKTDVWAFGILLWEIYTEGDEPYPGMTTLETKEKILTENYRMEMPKDTPNEVCELMTSCWEKDFFKRPEMSKVSKSLRDLVDKK